MSSSSKASLRRFLLPTAGLLMVTTAAAACSSGIASKTSSGIFSPAKLQTAYEQVARAVLPSVVQINTGNSTGSGVVYDSSGDIVTNEHVIGSATTAQVRDNAGGKELTANVVGKFAPDDLAVIRVTQDANSLKPAKFADSSDASIGEIVLAMGNPLGLTDSVTQGIISATGRSVGEGSGGALITAAIQTSAAINPGNSGGALVNLSDEVVGIPTLAATLPDQGGAAPGIGFAIPSNTVINIANQLIKSGKVTNSDRATIGISGQDAINQRGDPVGVAVERVTPGGAAASAGVATSDLIVGINDERVTNLQDLQAVLAPLKPGTTVTIHFAHNGSTKAGSGKLGSLGS